MSIILSIKDLSKTFYRKPESPPPGAGAQTTTTHHPAGERASVKALDQINLELPRGKVLGIKGPNGSGKSTLLRIIGTLLLPDQGSGPVMVNNVDVTKHPARVRPVLGLIAGDERSLNHRLTIRQNLEFFAALHGFSPRESRRQVSRVIDQLFLQQIQSLPFGKASTGMKQRAIVARGLLHEPRLILADELTRGLDSRAADQILSLLIDRYVQAQGATLVLVEHNHPLLHQVSDLIFHMEEGKGTMTINQSSCPDSQRQGPPDVGRGKESACRTGEGSGGPYEQRAGEVHQP